ncbi:protocadherin Fat 4-like [Euwallacea fornicatus]|uniref:protocadherin Fat 4-like n=1 Tax=Euwallacea fornicatus TaxID=995702 RepID=UPI00338DE5DE
MAIPWYIAIFFLHWMGTAKGFVIEPADNDTYIISWTKKYDNEFIMELKENNHDGPDAKHLLLFTVKELDPTSGQTVNWTFQNGEFSFSNELNSDGEYEFYTDQYMDYENEATHKYVLNSRIEKDFITITIITINIDDEPPTLTAIMCTMDENTKYTSDPETNSCTATLSDSDGWLGNTTFTIIDSNPSATEKLERESEIFDFYFDTPIADTVHETTVFLITKQELDYEAKIFYSFAVQARDGAGHTTMPNENVTTIVDVNDLNDMAPEWTDYFSVAQITEKNSYSFTIVAVDGDRGINAPIEYSLIAYDEDICTDSCVTVTTKNGKGIIAVNPIDRDAKDLTNYKIDIMAQEQDEPPFTANLSITFFLDDLDDNSPLFMQVFRSNDTNDNLVNVDTKIVEFTFYENFAGVIDGSMFIEDIDTGENAQFSVELSESKVDVEYTDAFLIIPTAGYRSGNFTINVKNATYLDFEDESWQNFSFYVHSSGSKNSSNEDELLVKIHLLDYNDELPIFPESTYLVKVPENIKKGEKIKQVKATDRDAEDKTLVHQLMGSSAIISGMTIGSADGVISVSGENYVFDYDRINLVIFQVQAIDKVDHITTVSVTLNITDVNNKAPTYKVENVISVEENQVIGVALTETITASDVDTTRDLIAEINWNSSYAMKNSQRLVNTDENLRAMQFLELSQKKTSEDTITITLLISDNNENQTAPDYETFDTLYLSIKITDQNTLVPEFEAMKSTEALIIVNIIDINDNKPIFTNNTLEKNRTVYERSAVGTIVGTIEAIDADVGDVVTYECTYLNESLDWFECDSEGEITAKTAKINCDDGPIVTVSINCSATDGFWITSQIFDIYILDKNNQEPVILVGNTDPSSYVVEVKEKSNKGTKVTVIGYHDHDRDIPFKTVQCKISQTEECYESFDIDEKNNVKVRLGGTDIDRDQKKANYTCTPTCYDNPNLEQGQEQNTNANTSFIIKLIDINDHCPELLTRNLDMSENSKKNEYLGDLEAEDIDEGRNADIKISVSKVTKLDGDKEIDFTDEELFDTEKGEDYYKNETIKVWHLIAKKDLRDYYGEYLIQFYLADLGEEPQTTEDVDNEEWKKKAKIPVTIRKFNYYPPVFVFPNSSKTSFVLTPDQEQGKQLAMFYQNDTFKNLEITNGAKEEPCLDKWNPKFEVSLVNMPASTTNFFTINSTLDRCTAQLQVNDKYDKNYALDIAVFNVHLNVKLTDGTPEDEEAAYSESIEITINFASLDDDPVFNETLGNWTFELVEADSSASMSLPSEREAYYANLDDSNDLMKYYFLCSEDKNVLSTFKVNSTTGMIGLEKKLNYLENTFYSFELATGRNKTHGSSKSASKMGVFVNVIDINNNVPKWTQLEFYGAITKNTQKGSIIVTINATDLDSMDQGNLVYSINSSIKTEGSANLDRIEKPFRLDSDSGAVNLNFQVEPNMNGYFTFRVKVQDHQDEYGNGPFDNRTTVTISIVTGDNIVTFKFENTLDTIVDKKVPMLQTISQHLKWECHEQDIDKDTNNGASYDNVTAANIYCTDTKNQLVSSNDMKTKLNNINTFQQLKQNLLEIGLLLQSFTADGTPVDKLTNTLKVALIAVSVVLGTMCLILGITFFFKTRTLNRRLRNLTKPKFGSDESQINRAGLNVPTSNLFAIEGANPIFNSQYEKDPMRAEVSSIHSDNSDLIGVEDSPEFNDMFGEVPRSDNIAHM